MSPERPQELVDLATTFAVERRSETIAEGLVQAARHIGNADGGAILLLDRLGEHMHTVHAVRDGVANGPALAGTVRIQRADGSGFNLEEPSTHALLTRKPIFIPDVHVGIGFDVSHFLQQEQAGGERLTSVLILPMRSSETVSLGVLHLFDLRDGTGAVRRAVAAEDLRLLQSIVSLGAVAIANARLFEENRRLIVELDGHNRRLKSENVRLQERRPRPNPLRPDGIVGSSRAIDEVMALVGRAARSRVPVLILGETGTGKELVARAIHRASDRAKAGFVPQNCAAMPEALLESELFGYRKGAFTGAVADTRGLVHEADGGTLFLDEIGDMPVGMQAKVLRLLQEGEVRAVGARKAEIVDVRIVAATHVDLRERIREGGFREDLYYRLGVFPIHLPPLRERPSDIPLLIDHFLAQCAATYGRQPPAFAPEAIDALVKWRYPGNIRELRNIVERAVLLSDDGAAMGLDVLPAEITGQRRGRGGETALSGANGVAMDGSLKAIMRRYERLVLETKLRESGWNQSRTAERLGISRRSMVEKISTYGLRRPDGGPIASAAEQEPPGADAHDRG